MDQSYPRARGEADMLLRIVDMLKLITDKHVSVADSLALLPTCYGHVPCGQEIIQIITTNSEKNLSTYLTSRDEVRAIERIDE